MKFMNETSLLEVIRKRRTSYQFLDSDSYPVEDTELKICLESAIWAPNHKLTQPWRFWVLGSDMQKRVAEVYAQKRAQKQSQNDPDLYQSAYDKALEKFIRIPKIVLVGQLLAKDPVIAKEDYAACACAIQNFQLSAWYQQIGVQWSTGPILNDPRTYEMLGIEAENCELIGVLYLGKIDEDCCPNQMVKRKPVAEVTVFTD
ncbi:nitroreductase [Thiomicrorhabdus sp. HH1]|uniref:Nitroreductase n=2 Tax=Piscirickettsiaceae TaxID=135616 RepID=A0ABS0C0N1_9GAMM|nr:nitroreductase [Thiomicrorhabdus heinhorstiae]